MKTTILALTLLRAALVIAIPLTAAWLWSTAPRPPILPVAPVQPSAPTNSEGMVRELSWYAPLWQRDWKQPPIPPLPTAQPPAPDPGPLPALLATLVEPSGRFAHFQGASGRVELRAVDESIGRYRVAAIEPGRVQLQDGERTLWVEVPTPSTMRK